MQKKTYSVEGYKKYYEIGIKNDLKNNLIFELNPDDPTWSYPCQKFSSNMSLGPSLSILTK